MTRILFVDEEPQSLDELQSLRRYRREWDVVFAQDSRAALTVVERGSFDIVVSDIRMTGVGGVELLRRVKEVQPGTVRIVLSKPIDRSEAARALPVAHQFLSKPCDLLLLQSALHRASELRRIFKHKSIHEVAGGIDKLPSVSDIYWELTSALASQQTSSEDIAEIIQKDPSMCARLLQIVNSAFFGLARCVTSIPEAIAYVGTEVLGGLILQQQLFASVQMISIDGFSLEEFQEHSLRTAKLAKKLIGSPRLADQAFTSALLHDIGKMLIAYSCPDGFAKVVEERRRSGRPAHVVEEDLLGITHAEVGGYLLGIWGLPLPIVESVAFHHSPSLCVNAECEMLAAVHVADVASKEGSGPSGTATSDELDAVFLKRARLTNVRTRGLALRDSEPGSRPK
jgi:HD-like signal output (HDOD) protein/CheY-like chemotaxis protein